MNELWTAAALAFALALTVYFFKSLPRSQHAQRQPAADLASTERLQATAVVTAATAPLIGSASEAAQAALIEAIDEANREIAAAEPPDAMLDDDDAIEEAAGRVRLIYQPDVEQEEPTAPRANIQLLASGDSDCGRRRAKNEDSFLFLPERGVLAVADGMGGYKGGQVASSLAIETIRLAFERESFEGKLLADTSLPRLGRELASAAEQANEAIFQAAHARPELRKMGTTLVGMRFSLRKQRLYIVHAGDSRCYRLRQGELRQLTTDHVMSNLGVVGQMGAHLFNAIGITREPALDLLVDKPLPGDLYLLCSDGLSKMVADETIRKTLLAEPDLESAVYTLIEHANDAGGRDNVTVLLARVFPNTAPQAYGASAGGMS